MLHSEDLLLGVGVVGDVDELAQFRGVNLLEFGGDEHGRGANQLQLASQNRHLRQKPGERDKGSLAVKREWHKTLRTQQRD